MHEMSLCEGIRRIVDQAAAAEDIARVTRVRLEIGRFASVEKEALSFAWDVVMRGSKAEGAVLEMIDLPGKATCFDCAKRVSPAYHSSLICARSAAVVPMPPNGPNAPIGVPTCSSTMGVLGMASTKSHKSGS